MNGRTATAAGLCAALALYATLALTSLRRKSATFDECAHLPAAYTHLALGDYRLSPDHPPLVKHLAALPLVLGGVTMKRDDSALALRRQWEFGRRFLYRWNDADTLFRRSRSAMVVLGGALAAAVFFWTRRLFGPRPAALALLLCVLSPEVLAHGQLVTTDLGAALFIFLAVVAFERVTERVTIGRVAAAGAALGAALATKFSALVLLPVLALLAVVVTLLAADRRARAAAFAWLLPAMMVMATVVIWGAYGFRSRFTDDPAVDAAIEWDRLRPESPLIAEPVLLARRLSLLPDPYLFGFFRFFKHSESRPAFLLGRRSDRGFWYYFPVTFALKTPLPLIVLLAVAVATRARAPASARAECFVWLPVAVYLALTLTRGIHIGNRHLLPIYPFLFVAAGRAAAWAFPPGRSWRSAPAGVVSVLVAWHLVATLRIHPHYLAYFNELAGGPSHGYRLLADSNLDWGQDLKELGGYLSREGIDRCKLSYFGTADPEYHQIPCELLPGYMLPRPRTVVKEVRRGDLLAISATNLQGLYIEPEVEPLMALLREREPMAQVGYSILIYRADFDWSVTATLVTRAQTGALSAPVPLRR